MLLLDDVELAEGELDKLKQQATVVRSQSTSRQGFIEEVNSLKNIKALYRHFGGARSIKVGLRLSYLIHLDSFADDDFLSRSPADSIRNSSLAFLAR